MSLAGGFAVGESHTARMIVSAMRPEQADVLALALMKAANVCYAEFGKEQRELVVLAATMLKEAALNIRVASELPA